MSQFFQCNDNPAHIGDSTLPQQSVVATASVVPSGLADSTEYKPTNAGTSCLFSSESKDRSSQSTDTSRPIPESVSDGKESIDDEFLARIFAVPSSTQITPVLGLFNDDIKLSPNQPGSIPVVRLTRNGMAFIKKFDELGGFDTDSDVGDFVVFECSSGEEDDEIDDEILSSLGVPFGVTQSFSINPLSDMLRSRLGVKQVDTLQFAYDFCKMVKILVKSDAAAARSVLYYYLRSRGFQSLESEALSRLVTTVTAAKPSPQIVTQALSDDIDQVGDIMEYTFDSAFADALKMIFICSATLGMFDLSTSMSIYKILGPKPAGTLYDIVRIAVKSLAFVVRAGERYLTGKYTLHEVLFARDEGALMHTLYSTLMFQKDFIAVGLVDPEQAHLVPRAHWLKESERCVEYYKRRLANTSGAKALYNVIENKITTLNAARATVISAANAVYRVAPFGVVIEGCPGIGKSNLIDVVCAFWCELINVKFDPSLIFHRNMVSDFMDGLKEQPFAHYSEMGSDKEQIARTGLPDVMSELLTVCDSQPMVANMAEAHEKGKRYINFDMVVADTNNPLMNFHHAKNNPAAYLRRFVYVHIDVLPVFRMEGGQSIDPSKVRKYFANPRNEKRHPMDLFDFKVYKYIAKSNTETSTETLLAKGDLWAFKDCMQNLMRSHMGNQDMVKEGRNSGDFFNFDPAKWTDVETDDEKERKDDNLTTQAGVFEVLSQISHRRDPKPFKGLAIEDPVYYERMIRNHVKTGKLYKVKLANAAHPIMVLDQNECLRVSSQVYYREAWMRIIAPWRMLPDRALPEVIHFDTVGSVRHLVGRMAMDDDWPGKDLGLLDVCVLTELPEPVRVTSRVRLELTTLWKMFCLASDTVCLAYNSLFGESIFSNAFSSSFVFFLVLFLLFFTPFGVILIPIWIAFNINVVKWKIFSFKLTRFDFVETARGIWVDFYDYMDWNEGVTFLETHVIGVRLSVILMTLAASAVFWLSFSKKTDIKGKTEGELDDACSSFGLGPSLARRENKIDKDQWGIRTVKPKSSVCLEKPTALATLVSGNVRSMIVTYPDRDNKLVGFATGLFGDWLVSSSHYFATKADHVVLDIALSRDGERKFQSVEKKIYLKDIVSVGDDLSAFRVPSMVFKDIRKHLTPDDSFAKTGEFYIPCVDHSGIAVLETSPMHAYHVPTKQVFVLSKSLSYDAGSVGAGHCGLPLIYMRDGGSAVCGFHCAGNGTRGFAGLLNRKLVDNLHDSRLLEAFSDPHVSNIVTNCVESVSFADPKPKSPFAHNGFENINYVGSLDKVVMMNQKSKLVRSVFSPILPELFLQVFNHCPRVLTGRPVMKPMRVDNQWLDPFSRNLHKVNKSKKTLDDRLLHVVVSTLTDHIVSSLTEEKISNLNPLTLELAINGAEYDCYLRRVSASKSAGFGFPGAKSKHLPLVDDTVVRMVTPELESCLVSILSAFEKGELVHFVYTAALKDEPRDLAKVAVGNTRVFFVSPLPLLVLQRMFLAPFYTLMVQFCDVFCDALGTDMHREGDEIYAKLVTFSDLWMEGDYGGYDVSMPFDIGLASSTVVYNVLAHFGYSQSALNVVSALLNEGLHPFVEMNGDVYTSPALQPSGKYATAEDNSLRGLVMLMYCWYSNPDLQSRNFFDYVKAVLYGDDMLAAVKPEVSDLFNNLTYARFVTEVYGMEFTTAQKGSVSQPFVSPQEASFLKRKFAYHPVLDRVVAPLDLDSLYKTLEWRLPSNAVSEVEQTISMADSTVREAYFHCTKQQHDRFRDALILVLETQWPSASKQIRKSLLQYDSLTKCFNDEPVYNLPEEMYGETQSKVVLLSDLERLETEHKELSDGHVPYKYGYKTYVQMRKSVEYATDGDFRIEIDLYFDIDERIAALDHTIKVRKGVLDTLYSRAYTQSGELTVADHGTLEDSTTSEVKNMTDIGGLPVQYEAAKSFNIAKNISMDLDSFFERPVELLTLPIGVSSTVFQTYNVWSLLSKDPSVRSKLRNFAMFRADIELTIEVASSPMHYGRLLLAWVPMVAANDVSAAVIGATSAYTAQRNAWLTQTRHNVLIDFRENKPTKMILPYISPSPMLRLYAPNSSVALAAASDYPDFVARGLLCVTTLVNLQATSATAPTSATLYLYARFVNVSVNTLTSTQTIITTESKEISTGPATRATGYVADVFAAIGKVPLFSSWALPGEGVFRGLSGLFSVFGWSVPRVDPSVDPPKLMMNMPFQNNCVTVSRSTAQKMSYDPTQSLCVDPGIVGVPEDELSLAFIFKTRSLLDTFTWSVSSTSMSTILWSAIVCPSANAVGPIALSTMYVQPTALSYGSQAFSYWRGEIVYTIDIVASIFHKGKLLIVYEPNSSNYTNAIGNPQLNKQYSLVVDIQEVTRISFCPTWTRPKMWKRIAPFVVSNKMVNAAITLPLNCDPYANGFIFITPFTALQSPDASSVSVNVYVHSDNLEVNCFDNTSIPQTRAFTQAGVVFPGDTTCVRLGEDVLDSTGSTKVHFGERPLSFRPYLKRYFTTAISSSVGVAGWNAYRWTREMFPQIYYSVWGITGSVGQPSLMAYLRYAYLGMNGGLRKRFYFGSASFAASDPVRVSLMAPSSNFGNGVASITSVLPDAKGSVAFVPSTQGGLEVELPSYTNNLFHPSGLSNTSSMLGYAVADPTYEAWWMTQYLVDAAATWTTGSFLMEETGASEDFTLFYWISSPPFSTGSY